jgi:hypothetical protein
MAKLQITLTRSVIGRPETVLPRNFATSSAFLRFCKPSIVARTMLIGVFDPNDLLLKNAEDVAKLRGKTVEELYN